MSYQTHFECFVFYRKLGLVLGKSVEADQDTFQRIAYGMFDTKLPNNATKAAPFGKNSTLNKVPVEVSFYNSILMKTDFLLSNNVKHDELMIIEHFS